MIHPHIKALVFDLDGTLYANSEVGREINDTACRYIASLKGVGFDEAAELIRKTREELVARSKVEPTLSRSCMELGGDLQDLHHRFAEEVKPERFLTRDDRVVDLLRLLGGGFELHLYTNNNRILAGRIIKLLGLTNIFERIFTIEDTWEPKPDRGTLEYILREIRHKPEECLFVGDRYDVDLRLPAELGCAVCLVKNVEELFPLCKLLHEENL